MGITKDFHKLASVSLLNPVDTRPRQQEDRKARLFAMNQMLFFLEVVFSTHCKYDKVMHTCL